MCIFTYIICIYYILQKKHHCVHFAGCTCQVLLRLCARRVRNQGLSYDSVFYVQTSHMCACTSFLTTPISFWMDPNPAYLHSHPCLSLKISQYMALLKPYLPN